VEVEGIYEERRGGACGGEERAAERSEAMSGRDVVSYGTRQPSAQPSFLCFRSSPHLVFDRSMVLKEALEEQQVQYL